MRGPGRAHFESLEEFFENHTPFSLGAPSYHRTAVGPDATMLVVAQGLTMATIDTTPVVWFQRGPSPRYGRDAYTLEVISPDSAVVESLLSRIRAQMASNSVLRGQVLSFAANLFDSRGGGALTFLPRPALPADQVILPEGLLDRIRRHVVGIGEQSDLLRRAGQHLKRGVLLYGPPGTGKTHIIRHLISSTPGVTVVLLSGRTLELLTTPPHWPGPRSRRSWCWRTATWSPSTAAGRPMRHCSRPWRPWTGWPPTPTSPSSSPPTGPTCWSGRWSSGLAAWTLPWRQQARPGEPGRLFRLYGG